MTKAGMDLSARLAKPDQGDVLRGIAKALPQLIIEADAQGLIGAGLPERSSERHGESVPHLLALRGRAQPRRRHARRLDGQATAGCTLDHGTRIGR